MGSGDLRVENCMSYVYLGAFFTQDGRVETATKLHTQAKDKHVMKFVSFVAKNTDCPFWIKRKVFEAALLTSVLYSAEAWLSKDLAHLHKMYMALVKTLLGVRTLTPIDICLTELGYCTLPGHVRLMQHRFISRLILQRSGMMDDPFIMVWNLCCDARTHGAMYIKELLAENDPRTCDQNKLRDRIKKCATPAAPGQKRKGTKFRTYIEVNPDLEPHPVYKDASTKEWQRIVFTRLRTSSHNLAVEWGRWARVPPENRLCQCGSVQTEARILLQCPLTDHIRRDHPDVNFHLSGEFILASERCELVRYSRIYIFMFPMIC